MKVNKQPRTAGMIILDILTCLLDEIVEFVVRVVCYGIMLYSLLCFSIRIELNSSKAINDKMTSLACGRDEFIVGPAGHVLCVFVICRNSTAVGTVLRSAGLGPVAGRRRGVPATMRAIINIDGVDVTIVAR